MRRLPIAVIIGSLVTGAGAAEAQWGGKGYEAARNATIDARDARVVQVTAKAGGLRIEGRAGLTEVRVAGTARASREDWLDDIQLRTERRGSTIHVDVDIPEWSWRGNGEAFKALDLRIEAPASMMVEVTDGSGGVDVRNVAGARVKDGSGEIELHDITGPIDVNDGSGEIVIRNATGDVRVDDGSGEIDIDGVTGSVTIADDGSGSIEIRRVTQHVRIYEPGSGSVRVSDVGGDLEVRDVRRSRVHYSDVRGTVRINGDR